MTTRDVRPDFASRFIADVAATAHAATVALGDRLGLYRALVDGGRQTAADLAARAGCRPRLVQEWLHAQVASGYCAHDAARETFWLEPEIADCLVAEDGPTFLMPYLTMASTLHRDQDRVAASFTGAGELGWGEHHPDLYAAFARSAAADYADLVPTWIPALDGIDERLRAGARVADIGCGDGAPTLLLAEAYPASVFAGFDVDHDAIGRARRAAAEAGMSDRVTFEVIGGEAVPGAGYDVVCTFDALHDMGNPLGVARRIRSVLAPGGTWVLIDRNAGDSLDENVHDVGRFSYSASTFLCVPGALAQGATDALGAQAGERRLRDVAVAAGFTRVRRAAESPLNLVLEIRP